MPDVAAELSALAETVRSHAFSELAELRPPPLGVGRPSAVLVTFAPLDVRRASRGSAADGLGVLLIERAADLRKHRLPKFLGYFERAVEAAGGKHALRRHSYVDLSLFQLLRGLEYAYPVAMRKLAPRLPRLHALADRVEARPNVAAYLASPRRLAFNTQGIFRHYPELDG